MKNLTRIVLLGIVLLTASAPVHAFSVDLDGTNAVGISDLEIGGTAYDVTFEFASAMTAPVACGTAVPCDVFFGDTTAAGAAVTAINVALNGSIAESVGSTNNANYFVPFSKAGQDIEARQGNFVANTMWQSLGASLDETDTVEMARFSPAVVPIPAAVWLFGSALGILGWIRHRASNHSLS